AVGAGEAAPNLIGGERDGPAHADLEAHLGGLPLDPQPPRPLVLDGDHLLPPAVGDPALLAQQRDDLFVGQAGGAAVVEPAEPVVPGAAGGAVYGVVRDSHAIPIFSTRTRHHYSKLLLPVKPST